MKVNNEKKEIFSFYSRNVSVNSKPDRPSPPGKTLGQFFWWENFPPPGQKESSKPQTPRAYKNELKPHPGAFSSIIHHKNT